MKTEYLRSDVIDCRATTVLARSFVKSRALHPHITFPCPSPTPSKSALLLMSFVSEVYQSEHCWHQARTRTGSRCLSNCSSVRRDRGHLHCGLVQPPWTSWHAVMYCDTPHCCNGIDGRAERAAGASWGCLDQTRCDVMVGMETHDGRLAESL
jgi:hypothetical protein